jgi:MraZ protein
MGPIGNFEVTLDAKGRITFPAGLKKQLPEGETLSFVAYKGFSNCIEVYTESEWEKIQNKLTKLSVLNPRVNDLKRLMLANSARLELDSAGRMLLPKHQITVIGLQKDVIILGLIDKMEIWDKTSYNEYYNKNIEGLADLANDLFGSELEL